MNPKTKKILITVVIVLVTLGVIAFLYVSAGKETLYSHLAFRFDPGIPLFPGCRRSDSDLWFNGRAQLCPWFHVHAGCLYGLAVLHQPDFHFRFTSANILLSQLV